MIISHGSDFKNKRFGSLIVTPETLYKINAFGIQYCEF